MNSRTLVSLRFPLALLTSILWAQGIGHDSKIPPSHESRITIRLRPDATEDTLNFLASITNSTETNVDATGGLVATTKQIYGSAQPSLVRLLQRANPQLEVATHNRSNIPIKIQVPAGPLWHFNIVSAHAGHTIRQQAQIFMGSSGKRTKNAIMALNPQLEGKWDSVPTSAIHLPYLASPVSLVLKPGVDPVVASARLKSDPATISVDEDLGLVPAWKGTGEITKKTCSPKPTSGASGWEFGSFPSTSVAALKESVVMAIVDSGIAENDHRFVFWSAPTSARRGKKVDLTSTFCASTEVGCDLVNRAGFPADDLQFDSHGTHVAGIATGRLLPETIRRDIDSRVKLMILKVVDANGQIDSGQIYNAILYSDANQAEIVNLSLSGPASEAIRDAMRLAQERLFVIAAGNPLEGPGSNLDKLANVGFPARYSQLLSNAISVAAHDSGGAIACFSNYGGHTIDIAAPGVGIYSTSMNEESGRKEGTGPMDGTSAAAPLVSFTAALLISEGFPASPRSVKQRLMVSADVIPQLHHVVVSEGKLDIVKALAFRDDLVQLKDHELLRGRILAPTTVQVRPRGNRLRWSSIVKIVASYSDFSGERSRVSIVRENEMVNIYGDLDIGMITIVTTDGKMRIVPMREIEDIVPRSKGLPGAG
jgi:hypothetical protein